MTEPVAPGQLRIGDALIAARARADLDLTQVEERTKIRQKYLRALEEENWDELPSASHAKGFLGTYAQLLGLDAELLVDEYRRQVEGPAEPVAGLLSDRLFERRRTAIDPPRPRPLLVIGALAVALAAALLIIGLVGDDDNDEPAQGREARQDGSGRDRARSQAEGDKGTVRIRIAVVSPVEVCLVGGEGNALIDGQVLDPGTREEYRGRRLRLRFPAGFEPSQLRLHLGDERVRLPAVDGPAAFEITPPARVREASPPGRSCP